MKGKKFTYQKVFVLGLAVYLTALVCVFAVAIAVIYNGNRNLVEIAQRDLAYYLEYGVFDPRAEQHGANNFVYAPDGTRMAFLSGGGAEAYFDFDGYAQELRRHIRGQAPVFRVKFSLNLPYHVAVAVAVPTEDGGVFLFLRELPEAYRVLLFLYLAITLLGAACILYLLLNLRSSHALEKMQRQYVDNISHELKTPIAAVKALAEPIYEGMVHDEKALQKYSGIILSEISGLERTVSDMLELSRIQTQRLDVKQELMTAETVFGDVIAKYMVLCDEFGLSFSVEPALEQWPLLRTNDAFAARLLEILLDNAFKFTEANGAIQVLAAKRQRHVAVTVKNDGPEIPPAAQKHIFERFYQGSKAHDKRGSGLGLAIAREIAVSLKESLWLEHSRPGDTAFSFTIGTQ